MSDFELDRPKTNCFVLLVVIVNYEFLKRQRQHFKI